MREKGEACALGIDLGTSSISAVVVGRQGERLWERAVANGSFTEPARPFFREQDAGLILETAEKLIGEACALFDLSVIGLTGQMHGVVYLDGCGRVMSPLATWEDMRGDQPVRGGTESCAGYLSRVLGTPVASGYGLATHLWNVQNGCVPRGARRIASVMDALALRLTGESEPVMHASIAASLGGYSPETGDFMRERLGELACVLPRVTRKEGLAGRYAAASGRTIPVATPIGDNQASFLGSADALEESVLVNVGTGSQISMTARSCGPGTELRPFVDGQFLCVGSALCGGRAYALLEKLFRAESGKSAYDWLNRQAEAVLDGGGCTLSVDTRFAGTRADPAARGSITGIGTDNLTPGQLACGVLYGIARELRALYDLMPEREGKRVLVASGNAVRLNPALQRILKDVFRMDVAIPALCEECAQGAALGALTAAQIVRRGEIKIAYHQDCSCG